MTLPKRDMSSADTYSFWLRVTDRKTDDSNIMEFNGQDGTTMPTVALGLKGSTTDLVFTVLRC